MHPASLSYHLSWQPSILAKRRHWVLVSALRRYSECNVVMCSVQCLLVCLQMQLITAGFAAHAHRQEQQANARKESA